MRWGWGGAKGSAKRVAEARGSEGWVHSVRFFCERTMGFAHPHPAFASLTSALSPDWGEGNCDATGATRWATFRCLFPVLQRAGGATYYRP